MPLKGDDKYFMPMIDLVGVETDIKNAKDYLERNLPLQAFKSITNAIRLAAEAQEKVFLESRQTQISDGRIRCAKGSEILPDTECELARQKGIPVVVTIEQLKDLLEERAS